MQNNNESGNVCKEKTESLREREEQQGGQHRLWCSKPAQLVPLILSLFFVIVLVVLFHTRHSVHRVSGGMESEIEIGRQKKDRYKIDRQRDRQTESGMDRDRDSV